MPMAESTAVLQRIVEQQTAWAEAREIDLVSPAQIAHADDNLFAPFHPMTRDELLRSRARPLGEAQKPGPLQLLHSTVALTCNVFDYWRHRCLDPLGDLCHALEEVIDIGFATRHPTGVAGLDSDADVLLAGKGGSPTALLTTYAEPYLGVDPRAPSLLTTRSAAWGPLRGCRGLAHDLQANPRRYGHLAVGRILSLVLAMTHAHGPHRFRLVYLWYEMPGSEARRHRDEIDRLRMRIGGEVDLVTRTWQELFADLQALGGEHTGHIGYLADRYFPAT
jgi:hypothetical protein